jgi:hypothetical protein
MANQDLVITQGNPQRELPAPQVNGVIQPLRTGRYMETLIQAMLGAKMQPLADEGSYFVANNATLGTPISGTTAPTAFSATTALLTLYNALLATNTPSKRIYLDFIALEVRAPGTSGTNFQYALNVDTGNRSGTGGTTVGAVSPNIDSAAVSIATLNVGALTAPAANAVRRVRHGVARSTIKVVNDIYLFVFGQSAASPTGVAIDGTAASQIVIQCPPVVLGPNSTFLLHEIAASQAAAATYEISMGWWER